MVQFEPQITKVENSSGSNFFCQSSKGNFYLNTIKQLGPVRKLRKHIFAYY